MPVHRFGAGVTGDDRAARGRAGVQRGLAPRMGCVDDDAELVHAPDEPRTEVGHPAVRTICTARPDVVLPVVGESDHPGAKSCKVSSTSTLWLIPVVSWVLR